MENNIENVYLLALKLGLESASDIEKSMFKNELIHLVSLSAGEIRNEISEYFTEKNTEIINYKQ